MPISRHPLRPVVLAIGVGLVLTLAPFFLPISWQKIAEFCHWPMLLVDRPHVTWLPLNAGKRVITLFLINVAGWALSVTVFWTAGRMVWRNERPVLKD
jgi:hypothetical protein